MLSLLLATLLTQATMSPSSDLSTNRVRATGAAGARSLRDHLRTLPDAEIVASGATVGRGFVSKLGDQLSVKDFGAVGNGSTNDTAALQAAADAMEAAGGGTLYFPAGTYMGCINLGPKVNLEGAGIEATRIKMPSGANCAAVIQTKNFATYDTPCNYAVAMSCTTIGGTFRSRIANLTVDGNKSANTAGRGIQLYGRAYYLQNLSIESAYSDGLYTGYNGSDDFSTPAKTLESVFHNLSIQQNGGAGWLFKGPHDSIVRDIVIFSNGGWGWDVWFSVNAHAVNTYVNDLASPGTAGGIWCHNVCAIYGTNITGSNATGWGGRFDTGGSAISSSSWGCWSGPSLELRNSSNQTFHGVIGNSQTTGLLLNGYGASCRCDLMFGGGNTGNWIDAVGGSLGATQAASSINVFSYSDEGVLFASSTAPPGEVSVVIGGPGGVGAAKTGIWGRGKLRAHASYDMQDAVAFTDSAWTDMIYNTKVSDSGDDYVYFSSTTWRYTAPTDGMYLVDAMVSFDGTATVSYFSLFVNGAEKKRVMGSTPATGGTMAISSVVKLGSGDQLVPRVWVNQPGRSSLTSRLLNWIHVERLAGK